MNLPEPGQTGIEDQPAACPVCRKRGPWLAGKWRPFCSKRCSLVDLGNWFDANYSIGEPLRPDHFTEFEELAEDIDPDGVKS